MGALLRVFVRPAGWPGRTEFPVAGRYAKQPVEAEMRSRVDLLDAPGCPALLSASCVLGDPINTPMVNILQPVRNTMTRCSLGERPLPKTVALLRLLALLVDQTLL